MNEGRKRRALTKDDNSQLASGEKFQKYVLKQ